MRVPRVVGAVAACTFAMAIAACGPSAQASKPPATAEPPASASPANAGCPDGYDLLSIAWLKTQGPYVVPGQLDDPIATSSYKPGNGDGYVCAQAKPHASGATSPITYDFLENAIAVSSPAS